MIGTQAASYDPDLMPHSFAGELARLEAQAALSWPAERRRLAALGVSDGERLLDLGCGPGCFAARLAEWLPRAHVVALDAATRMVVCAAEVLAGPLAEGRASLVRATADTTTLNGGSIDTVVSRYLFQHLENPLAAAVEARRVLRPGGRHIIIDVDDAIWGLADPAFPAFAGWSRTRAQTQAERGGDRCCGRYLGRLLRDAGYVNVHLDTFSYDSDEAGMAAFAAHLDPDKFLPLVEAGRMSFVDYVAARELWRCFLGAEDPFVLAVNVIAYGEAPA